MKSKSKESKPKKRVRLTLTEKEARLLSGLSDFPVWRKQPDELREFLEALNDALIRAGYYSSAVGAGYKRGEL